MCEKIKILDELCFDLDLGYGVKGNVLYLSKANPDYLIKRIKRRARELGVRFRTKKDYIDFFIEE